LKLERNATNEVKKIDKLLSDARATETPTQLCPENLEHSNGEETGRDETPKREGPTTNKKQRNATLTVAVLAQL